MHYTYFVVHLDNRELNSSVPATKKAGSSLPSPPPPSPAPYPTPTAGIHILPHDSGLNLYPLLTARPIYIRMLSDQKPAGTLHISHAPPPPPPFSDRLKLPWQIYYMCSTNTIILRSIHPALHGHPIILLVDSDDTLRRCAFLSELRFPHFATYTVQRATQKRLLIQYTHNSAKHIFLPGILVYMQTPQY